MSFEEIKAKIAAFKKTGELDKVIMTKLAASVPVKHLFYKFLENAAKESLEFESDNEFLNWLNGIASEYVCREQDGLPIRDTVRVIIPGKKIMMNVLEADRVFCESMMGLVAMIRAAPRPPIEKYEAERIRRRYGVEIV